MAQRGGFEVVTEDRNASNKEKKIETGIVTQMSRDAYRNAKAGDTFTIVSGDADYVPTVETPSVVRSWRLRHPAIGTIKALLRVLSDMRAATSWCPSPVLRHGTP